SIDGLRFVLDATKTIVYVDRKMVTLEVATYLRSLNPAEARKVAVYHALFTEEYKVNIMKRFIEGDIKVLVSTEATGMGCDVKDVGRVVQYKCPKTISLTTLVQRLGRSARGKDDLGEAVILTTGKTEPDCKHVKQLVSGSNCLREVINEHYNNPRTNRVTLE
ncbi:hypothetical protein DFQ27_002731, partial [Actinomortierella ambigua]